MIFSIIKKEWLKLKYIILAILVISCFIVGYFTYNLDFLFHTVEPESMMWYRFVNLSHKPYEDIFFFLLFIALVISLAQFLPEKIKNRIKILTHLPISLEKAILLHLVVGFLFIILLNLLIFIAVVLVMNGFYPKEILFVVAKDFAFYSLGSLILYLGMSSAIIEKKILYSLGKIFLTIFVLFLFYKKTFHAVDIFYSTFLVLYFLMLLDSFYSIKEQRIKNSYYFLFIVLFIPITCFYTYSFYKQTYQLQFNKYYIFYSPLIKKFVYQKNFGEHQFEYGIQDEKTFNREKYESFLPFVYYRNLDIQKKLPIKIDGELYTKNMIRKSRLSFTYNPSYLENKEVQLYPLINPNSKIGVIKFPEEMFAIKKDKFEIHSFNTAFDDRLSKELNLLLQTKGVLFPIKNIWGKTTNMKPFDLGYFFIDSKNILYRLNRVDNQLYLQTIKYPKNIKINFMKISENKQQKLAGYVIDENSNFYLIDYNTFELNKLELNGFDYKKMKLQFISNPKYYQVRFNDEKNYYAVIFDKNFKKLDEIVFK